MHPEEQSIDDELFVVQVNSTGPWYISAGYCGADAIQNFASHHYAGRPPIGTRFHAYPLFPGRSPIGWPLTSEQWFGTQAPDGLHIHGKNYKVKV